MVEPGLALAYECSATEASGGLLERLLVGYPSLFRISKKTWTTGWAFLSAILKKIKHFNMLGPEAWP